MAIFGKKKESIAVEELPELKDEGEFTNEEIKIMQEVLLAREEVKIFFAANEGKKFYDLATKLGKAK